MGEGKNSKSARLLKEAEISNVELQFLGKTDAKAELDSTVNAESSAPGEYQKRGLDRQDVAEEQSMDASDPPSSNMGEPDE